MRSWVRPSLRWCTTRWPAKASTSSRRTAGSWAISGCQSSGGRRRDRRGGELEVGAGVVVQHQEAVLAGDHRVVEGVLQALARARRRPASRRRGRRRRGSGTRRWSWSRSRSPGTGRCGCGRRRPRTGRRSRGGPARRRPGRCRAGAARSCRRARRRRRSCSRSSRRSRSQVAPPRTPVISSASSSPVVEVLDPDRVALVADHVGGVGEQVAVGADRGAAEREELVALGERVEVEQHLLAGQRRLVGRGVLGGLRRGPVVRVGDRDAAAGAVLLALEGAAVVPVARGCGSAPTGRSRGCAP